MITSPLAVMAILVGVAAFWFWMERVTGWKLFQFMVPLIWIYATPVVLRNVGLLPASSPAYDGFEDYGLPVFIILLLVSVNVGSAFRIMGKGIFVMLLGTAGVVLGAPIGYFVVKGWLAPDAWSGYGMLAGSWIGGTGNMMATKEALGTSEAQAGLAIMADTVIYVGWLPLLLISKNFAEKFNRWAGVAEDRLEKMEAAALAEAVEERPPQIHHVLYLGALALAGAWVAAWLSQALPPVNIPGLGEVISDSTWNVLILSTIGIALSFTPARKIPSSHNLAMGVVYVFVANMGAQADLSEFTQAPAFLAGTAIWILVHGLFCLVGAYLFKVDIHSVAIASAANIGGAASAPVVAAYHRESLVPVSILMALIGYALGNYLAPIAGFLCKLVGG